MLVGCTSPPRSSGRASADPAGPALSTAKDPLAVEKKVALSDEALESLTSVDLPGCSAAVAVEGELVWAAARGLADLTTGVPLTTSTRFDIASVSKQFTATALLLLQGDGLLSLTDPVSRYVEGLPGWADEVTLEALLHHTARIPDYWVELDRVGIGFADAADQSTTVAAIARESEREPGDGYFYSNSHYVLLASVIERVSGQSLPDFLAARVFGPLDLAMAVAPTARAADVAMSYEIDLQPLVSGLTAYGHTGIITTPSELARWGDQYRTSEIVPDDLAAGAVPDGDGARYGPGIFLNDDGTLSHSGRWGGYLSNFRVSVDRETVMAVACNGRGADRAGLAEALWQIWTNPGTEGANP